METMLIGMYFLAALGGIFTGLFLGLNIRSFSISRAEKRRYMRHYVKKKKTKKKKRLESKKEKIEKKPHKKESGILTERVPEKDSYTGFVCDSSGEDAVTKIEKMRHSQDQKYVNKAKK